MEGPSHEDIVQKCHFMQQVIGPAPVVKIGPFANIAGTQARQKLLIVEPTTLEQVQMCILGTRRVGLRMRAIGMGSFLSPQLPDEGHVLLLTRSLQRHDGPRIELRQNLADPTKSELVVGAGVTNAELLQFQLTHDIALPNNVNGLVHTVGGLVSNMCSGYGKGGGSMAGLVVRLRVIDADTNLQVFDIEKDADLTNAARGCMGLFGVIYDVALRVGPSKIVGVIDTWAPAAHALFNKEYLAKIVNESHGFLMRWIPMNSLTGGQIAKAQVIKRLGKKNWNPANDEIWIRALNIPTSVGSIAPEKYNNRPSHFTKLNYRLGRKICQSYSSTTPKLLVESYRTARQRFDGGLVQKLPNALHFIRNAHQFPLWTAGFSFSFDAGASTATWAIQELVQVVYEFASKGKYPLNAYMELRVSGGSDAFLDPGYSGSLLAGGSGFAGHFELNCLPGTQGWAEFVNAVAGCWLQSPEFRPHWDTTLGFIPELDNQIRRVYGSNLDKFKAQLARSGADSSRLFFNSHLEYILFGGVGQIPGPVPGAFPQAYPAHLPSVAEGGPRPDPVFMKVNNPLVPEPGFFVGGPGAAGYPDLGF